MPRRKRPDGERPLTRSEVGRVAARTRWDGVRNPGIAPSEPKAGDEPRAGCFGPMGRKSTFPYCNCGRHMLEPGHEPDSLADRIQQLGKPSEWDRYG